MVRLLFGGCPPMRRQSSQQHEEHHQLTDNEIELRVLTIADSEAFFKLHTSHIIGHKANSVLSKRIGEAQEDFISRILACCELVWLIRWKSDPSQLIGSCVLFDDELRTWQFEGMCLPQFQDRKVLTKAFRLVSSYVSLNYDVVVHRPNTGMYDLDQVVGRVPIDYR